MTTLTTHWGRYTVIPVNERMRCICQALSLHSCIHSSSTSAEIQFERIIYSLLSIRYSLWQWCSSYSFTTQLLHPSDTWQLVPCYECFMIMIIPACMKCNDPLHCVIHLASEYEGCLWESVYVFTSIKKKLHGIHHQLRKSRICKLTTQSFIERDVEENVASFPCIIHPTSYSNCL